VEPLLADVGCGALREASIKGIKKQERHELTRMASMLSWSF
jgi:hypothetical protein